MRRRVAITLFCSVWPVFAGAANPDPCTPPNFPLPQFKTAVFDVRDFGATGNGKENDTGAINRAIEKCNQTGGGDVRFSAGTYLAASVHLQSNVRLLLDKDAVITGASGGYDAPEPNDFDKYQDFGHSHFHNSLMWGEKIENFAIVGGRVNGGHILQSDGPHPAGVGDKVIAIKSGRNLLFDGVTHESGGHFVYLLNDCENVTLQNVVVRDSRDAVNLVSCRNVQVHGCRFTGCGDDTLALKSDYALGRKIESANIYIWDNYLESAANALVFGAETVGNFRNVNVWNIQIGRAWKAGIGIHSADGALIEDVTCRNVSMKSVDTPISITVGKRLLHGDPDRKIGAIRNITISDLTVTEPRPRSRSIINPSLIAGLPESAVENIVLQRVRITGNGGGSKPTQNEAAAERGVGRRREMALAAAGFFITNARNVKLQDVDLSYESAERRPSLIARNVVGLKLEELTLQRFAGVPLFQLREVENLEIARCRQLSDRKVDRIENAEE